MLPNFIIMVSFCMYFLKLAFFSLTFMFMRFIQTEVGSSGSFISLDSNARM